MNLNITSRYDYALSFAGEQREIAKLIYQNLSENEIEVFYDHNEQARILSKNIEDYLGPIYRSEAKYVITLLSKEFPKKIWTNFESDQFKERFGKNSVIPIWFSDVDPSIFDESRKYGGYTFNTDKDIKNEITNLVDLLLLKLRE